MRPSINKFYANMPNRKNVKYSKKNSMNFDNINNCSAGNIRVNHGDFKSIKPMQKDISFETVMAINSSSFQNAENGTYGFDMEGYGNKFGRLKKNIKKPSPFSPKRTPSKIRLCKIFIRNSFIN